MDLVHPLHVIEEEYDTARVHAALGAQQLDAQLQQPLLTLLRLQPHLVRLGVGVRVRVRVGAKS